MITVIGAGAIGRTISDYLSQEHDVAVMDLDAEKLQSLERVRRIKGTVDEHWDVIDRSDAVIVALPGSVSFDVVRKLLSHGRKVIDISFSERDPYDLEDIAEENGGLLIPDAGFAPGLSNILAGKLHSEGLYSSIEIYVSGLPQQPKPPLNYSVTWSIEGLIDEYTRPARIVENGKVLEKDPLSEISCFHAEGIGEFEAFYSDGLRTLIRTLDGVDIFERTLRYSGHLERIRILRDLGFFSDEPFGDSTMRKFTEHSFERMRTGEKDFSLLVVRGIGRENKEFYCLDYYDEKLKISSMSRMTGYTASVIAEAVVQGKLDGKGVLPPEKIGYNMEAFNFIREKLNSLGIKF